jgi:cold shock CspA family protein
MTGRIAQVLRSRACGFIRAEDGQEVFFHASDLLDTSLTEIEDCLAVRFTLIPDPISGPRAARVRIDRRGTRKHAGRTLRASADS